MVPPESVVEHPAGILKRKFAGIAQIFDQGSIQ
jgi:hypothetical protein